MKDISLAVHNASIDDMTMNYLGKPILTEVNHIGYLATSQMVKICFDILNGIPFRVMLLDPINEVDLDDDDSIKRVFEMYKNSMNDHCRQLKRNNVEIDNNSIAEIRELLNRIIGYVKGKELIKVFKDVYLLDNDIFTLYISKNIINLNKCSGDTVTALDWSDGVIGDKEQMIKEWRIYNPRLDEEWICNLQNSIESYNTYIENLKKEEERTIQEFESQFDSPDIDIEPFEFNMLYDEEFINEGDPSKQYVFDHVKDIKNKLSIPFKDAFYLFADDRKSGKRHGKNDFVFDGKLYTSKNELYKELFPDYSTDAIHQAVNIKMKRNGESWEQAVRSVLKNPPESRNKEIIYNGKRYKSMKNLYKVLFPKKRYESISSSINTIIQKESVSLEEAIRIYKEKGKPRNRSKEFDYNGKHYTSMREACRELGLKPEAVSYYSKHKFENNYSKAIDYLLNADDIKKGA